MCRIFAFLFILLLSNIPGTHASLSNTGKKHVYIINIKKEIDNTTQIYLKNGLNEANKLNADAVLIHMNTYGGYVDAADSMRTAILYNPIPVYVFIDNNAASAGALISIACKKIYMRKGANIGAATVVEQTGKAMPDKYQSYMRSMIRSTAEAHGKDTIIQGNDTILKWKRDPLIAEAMVDERTIIPNLTDSGKVLTLTADEALQWGYCDGIAETKEEVISKYLRFADYETIEYQPTLLDNLKGFLMNPILQSMLIIFIIGGIYFEMHSPGLGFPSIVAITAAVLYFAPLYIDGLALYWEIALFIFGIILILIEIFALPGFGIAGIGGAICIFIGLTTALLNNIDFNFGHIDKEQLIRASSTVLSGLLFGSILAIWLASRIGKKGIFQKIALETALDGQPFSEIKSVVGSKGFAATDLRPSGKVFVKEEIYDAVSDFGFIEKGTPVKIVRQENAQIYVVPIPEGNT